MVPPEDKQKDAGQFNAWLTNLAPKPPARPGAPGQTPVSRAPIGKPAGMPSAGGLLGAGLDDELDDIFGKIVTDDASQGAFGQPSPAAAPTMPKPSPMLTKPQASPPLNVPPPPRTGPLDIPAMGQPKPTAPVQPRSIFGQSMVPPSAVSSARSVETKAPSPAEPYDAGMKQMIEQMQLRHQSDIQNAVNKAKSELQTQVYQMQQRYQADIQNATNQGKAEVQSKVQEIQLKYQEQRQKWEKGLLDLRSRNEELTSRNHELEEQLAQLRERQRMLIQEYTGISAPTSSPSGSAAPRPIMESTGPEIIYPSDNIEPSPAIPEINIEMPEILKEGSALESESAADKEIMVRNGSTLSESDDLLAELDDLENEMKNLGESK